MFSRLYALLSAATVLTASLIAGAPLALATPATPSLPLVAPVTMRPPMFTEEDANATKDFHVAITDFEPRVLTDESTLVISGVVSNQGTTPLPAPTLKVFMQAHTPVSMEELSQFFAGLLWNGPLVATTTLPSSLTPGQSAPFSFSIDRADLPLEGQLAWGPRGVTVEAAAGEQHSRDRSVALWDSGAEFVPSGVNVVVPWTVTNSPLPAHAPALAGQIQTNDAVTLAVDPEALNVRMNGSHNAAITSLVQERILQGKREIIPLLPLDGDPGLISQVKSPWVQELCEYLQKGFPSPLYSPQSAGDDTDPDGDGTQSEAQSTAESDGAAQSTDPVQPNTSAQPMSGSPDGVTQGDAPSSGQSEGGSAADHSDAAASTGNVGTLSPHAHPADKPQSDATQSAGANGLPLSPRLPVTAPVLDTVRWPSPESFGLDFLAHSPDLVTLAPPGAVFTSEDVDFLPAPRVEVDTVSGETIPHGAPEGTATVLTSPEYLSQLLGWGASTTADNLDRDQLLGAAGAIITRERPNTERSFLALMPRTTQLTGDTIVRLRALTDHRWLKATTLSAIMASEPTDIPRFPVLPTPSVDENWHAVSTVDASLDRLTTIEAAVSDPQPLRAELTRRTFEALSASYDPRQRQVAANLLRIKADAYSTAVYAEPSAPVNVISTSVNFPVRVVNALPWDVRVRVGLDPSDPRMRVVQAQEVTIPANSALVVEVPVKAIGSGDINVTYKVTTLTGELVDDSHSVSVRLRAEWEDTATITVAILVGIAFISGLFRTIRRRMRTSEGLPGAGGSTPTDTTIPVSDASPLLTSTDTLSDETVPPPKDE